VSQVPSQQSDILSQVPDGQRVTVIMAGKLFSVLLALHSAWAYGHEQQQRLRPSTEASFIHEETAVEQQLRVCNAFASSSALDIYHQPGGTELTARDGPLAYKQCRDFSLALRPEDKIQLQSQKKDVGDFVVSGLPQSTSLLLLVPHRRSGSSFAAFKSHAFSDDNVETAKVVTIDAYRGSASDAVDLISIFGGQNASAPEEERLAMDSVVDLNPGFYHVGLAHPRDKLGLVATGGAARAPFHAERRVSYVVVRVGDHDGGDKFPQELIVFPNAAVSVRLSQNILLMLVLTLTARFLQ